MNRSELISQLRTALHLAESPNEEVVEFELGETDFVFDFTEQSKGLIDHKEE